MEKRIILDENTNEKVEKVIDEVEKVEKVVDEVEKVEKVVDEVEEETLPEEWNVDFTSDSEYISAAYNALHSVDSIDTALLTKADEQRVKRIKRQSLRIISECLNTMYNEIFDDNAADGGDSTD